MLGSVSQSARSLGRATLFLAWTGAVVYGHRFLARVDARLEQPHRKRPFIRAWQRLVFPLFGLELYLVEGRPPATDDPLLVVSNHTSPFDILLLMRLVGGSVLSHDGVSRIPVVGAAAEATDTIFVDRDDARSGASAIRGIRKRLRAGGNVIAFPEGTTFAGDHVRAFKRGVFAAARGLPRVKVLPVGFAYPPECAFVRESFSTHLHRMAGRRRTPIWVTIGAPQSVPQSADDEAALRRHLQTLVDRAANARDATKAAR